MTFIIIGINQGAAATLLFVLYKLTKERRVMRSDDNKAEGHGYYEGGIC